VDKIKQQEQRKSSMRRERDGKSKSLCILWNGSLISNLLTWDTATAAICGLSITVRVSSLHFSVAFVSPWCLEPREAPGGLPLLRYISTAFVRLFVC